MKLHLPKTLLAAVIAACMMPMHAEETESKSLTLQTGKELLLDGNKYINDKQTLTGNVEINGKDFKQEDGGYPQGYSLALESGAEVSITGDLKIESKLHMSIVTGASLSVTGNLTLGHDVGSYPADLTMTGGDLSVGSILFHCQNANKVSITGGTLTIEGSEAITQDGSEESAKHNNLSALTIGGTGEASVILKTGSNAVTFDYAPLQLGNVTIDAANSQAITITNATLNGKINNLADRDKLVLSGNNTLGENAVTTTSKYYTDETLTTESESGNGYVQTTVSSNIGSKLTFKEGVIFTFEGRNLTYDEASDSYQTIFTDPGVYYVNSDTDYSSDMADATHIHIGNDTSLHLKSSYSENIAFNFLSGGGNLSLESISDSPKLNVTIDSVDFSGNITTDSQTSLTIGSLTGSGTLTKKGAGTLTINNSSSHVGTIDMQAGTMKIGKEQGAGEALVLNKLRLAGGTTQITNNTELTKIIGCAKTENGSYAVLTVDSGATLTTAAFENAEYVLNGLSGEGTLKYSGTSKLTLGYDREFEKIDGNFDSDDIIEFNAHDKLKSMTIYGSATSAKDVEVVSKAIVNVSAGGTLTSQGKLVLGHKDNPVLHPGFLMVEGTLNAEGGAEFLGSDSSLKVKSDNVTIGKAGTKTEFKATGTDPHGNVVIDGGKTLQV